MPGDRPNVLFLLSDQHSYCYEERRDADGAGEQVVAPTLDALAERGTAFDGAYCQAPLCTPSRLSMLTGKHAPEAGGWQNKSVLFPEHTTLPEAFSEAGYETCLVGKMHLGGDQQFVGFDNRPYGDLTGEVGHQFEPVFGEMGSKINIRKGAGEDYYEAITDPEFNRTQLRDAGTTEIPESLLQEQNTVRETVSFLREHRAHNPEQPWFACASLSRPHKPLTAPQRHLEKYALSEMEIPERDREDLPLDAVIRDQWKSDELSTETVLRARRAYAACISYIDEIVGDLLSMLRADGLLENTIVVYTSDHGEMAGEHGLWGKVTWRERSVRVPLLFQLPGHRSGDLDPSTVSTPVSLADLFPTLCGLVDVSPPEGLVGTDLSAAVRYGTEPDRGPVVCDNFSESGEMMTAGKEFRMVREEHYKYVRFRNGDEVLVDLEADPHETTNVIEGDGDEPVPRELREFVDRTLDFESVVDKRARDIERAEDFRLGAPPGHGNVYQISDNRLVDADALIYQPNLLSADGSVVIDDWPDDPSPDR